MDMMANDVWALGILLYTMIALEFPQLRADETLSKEYTMFVIKGDYTRGPWKSIPSHFASVLKNMLNPNPKLRMTTPQIKDYVLKHWPEMKYVDINGDVEVEVDVECYNNGNATRSNWLLLVHKLSILITMLKQKQ